MLPIKQLKTRKQYKTLKRFLKSTFCFFTSYSVLFSLGCFMRALGFPSHWEVTSFLFLFYFLNPGFSSGLKLVQPTHFLSPFKYFRSNPNSGCLRLKVFPTLSRVWVAPLTCVRQFGKSKDVCATCPCLVRRSSNLPLVYLSHLFSSPSSWQLVVCSEFRCGHATTISLLHIYCT